MSILSIFIVWCDVSFENNDSYQSMQDEFNEASTGTPKRQPDPIDMAILNDDIEKLRSDKVPLAVVRTIDDALREIANHKDEKVFVICSGSVGRCLVPMIAQEYPYVHDIYIYAHNIGLHVDWADHYIKLIKMFNFHTNLLVRLTRDISKYFIERGKIFLSVDEPRHALKCLEHAQKLEIEANRREKMKPNLQQTETYFVQPDFRDNLDQLEGTNGLIATSNRCNTYQRRGFRTFSN
ncbi:hypothetical protein I4U23_015150 [Adineta vaga]|nr:hypothetical protein I4U23_015150 [Adineta vaga]